MNICWNEDQLKISWTHSFKVIFTKRVTFERFFLKWTFQMSVLLKLWQMALTMGSHNYSFTRALLDSFSVCAQAVRKINANNLTTQIPWRFITSVNEKTTHQNSAQKKRREKCNRILNILLNDIWQRICMWWSKYQWFNQFVI